MNQYPSPFKSLRLKKDTQKLKQSKIKTGFNVTCGNTIIPVHLSHPANQEVCASGWEGRQAEAQILCLCLWKNGQGHDWQVQGPIKRPETPSRSVYVHTVCQ